MADNFLKSVKYRNKVEIEFDDETLIDRIAEITEQYKITPEDLFRILGKFGKWDQADNCYYFENYESAGKAIDEIESYLVINKLTGE